MRITLTFVCLLVAHVVHAGALPTFDSALNALGITQQFHQAKELYESVQQTANQVRQIQNQVEQVRGMFIQIDQAARNLARLDVTNAADLLGMLTYLDNKLAQARNLGYQADNAVRQAQGIYPRIQGILTPEQQRELAFLWATARRDSAQVSIAVQAVREAQSRTQAQWSILLGQAKAAEGALQIHQVTVQAQAVVGHQLMAIEQQLAAQAREQSMHALEAASRAELEQTLTDAALRPLEGTYVPQGRLLRMPQMMR